MILDYRLLIDDFHFLSKFIPTGSEHGNEFGEKTARGGSDYLAKQNKKSMETAGVQQSHF